MMDESRTDGERARTMMGYYPQHPARMTHQDQGGANRRRGGEGTHTKEEEQYHYILL
jgi:hypothetical protein